MSSQILIDSSLEDVAPTVWFFPKGVLAGICGIGKSTLDRYRDDLIKIQPDRFEWHFYGGGYTKNSAECIYQYAELIKMTRISIARQVIKPYMKEFWKQYDAKKNG